MLHHILCGSHAAFLGPLIFHSSLLKQGHENYIPMTSSTLSSDDNGLRDMSLHYTLLFAPPRSLLNGSEATCGKLVHTPC